MAATTRRGNESIQDELKPLMSHLAIGRSNGETVTERLFIGNVDEAMLIAKVPGKPLVLPASRCFL
jgi:hypothetical protein